MAETRRVRQKPDTANSAEKEQYLTEAARFAATVAEQLNEPEAEKIFCPAFKVKACGCVQRYITGGDAGNFPSEGAIQRANDLLRLHQEARRLKSKISTDRHDKGDKRVLRMVRAEGFERFILTNRSVVRQEMGICERACQRLLFYSNNFLHKDLKTGPEKGPRIKRMGGKKLTRQELRPVAELAKEVCCPDRCVRIALTQYKLVESWRKVSQTNQQGVRKVVQEMLADNGEQTNCHKFITMVTGCSYSVIYKAKEHLRRHREQNGIPAKTWLHTPKRNKKTGTQRNNPQQSVENSTSIQLHVPDTGHREYNGHHLMELLNVPQPQRHEANMSVSNAANSGCATTSNVSLQEMHYHMEQQQPTFSQFIQTLSTVNPNQVMSVGGGGAESPPHTLTVLGSANSSAPSYVSSSHPHFQFMDNRHPQVLISVPEALQGQAISVITSPTSLEPLSSSPFGNVVILPESAIFMPGTHMQTTGSDGLFRTVL